MNYKILVLLSFFFFNPFCLDGILQKRQKNGLKIGNQAPNFELPMIDQTLLSLESLRGNIVFVDFWASWCRGCRNKKGTISVYNKFKDRKFKNANGFTILSVSFDVNKEAWINAISNDGLIWPYHVCDFKSFSSPVFKLYKLGGIPRNWLIDANGIIIARDIGYSELNEQLIRQSKD